MGAPGETGIPTDIPGNILADIHHILLIQDGNEDATAQYLAPMYEMGKVGGDWDTKLDIGDMTSIVAKAATQTEEVIPVEFEWVSKDPVTASVDDGVIEGLRNGSTTIEVTAVGRGIKISFGVSVLADVKLVVLNSPTSGYYLPLGESVALEATAWDAKENGETVDTDITFTTSNADVVSIDGSTATAEGVGSAKVRAWVGDVKSDEVTINVSPGGDLTHQLTYTRISEADRTITRTVTSDAGATPVTYSYDQPVMFTVQVRKFTSEGTTPVDTAASDANLDTESQDQTVIGADAINQLSIKAW